MAINDISLTSGMRSNLLSLQNTVNLLDRTQNRLSTGKKVNTAMDNPVSYFAAQTLNSRAAIIDGLKDAMGQAVQTITAADKGITALSTMIEQAKGLAQSAQSAAAGSTAADTTGNADVVETNYVNASITFGAIADAETITIDGEVFTVLTVGAVPADGEFGDADDLAAAINANTTLTDAGYSASVVGGNVIIAIDGADVDLADIASTMTGYAEAEAEGALASVTMTFTVGVTAYTGTAATAVLAAADLATELEAVENQASTAVTEAGAVTITYEYVPSDEMTSIVGQYNTLLTQMDELAEDSGYKGKNLLSADTLTVQFEGTTLDVVGFDASANVGLGIIDAVADDWGSTPTDIDDAITTLDAALVTLRNESSKMAGNLSIITVRQDFSTNMINTLNSGSDKLTLADANEEGANMLMLQTRQSLSTTALSLSAQAAQSVLRLFQ